MPALPGYHRNLHTDFTDGSMILTWGLDVSLPGGGRVWPTPSDPGGAPLDPDPLFFLSFAAPSIFQDFSGNLDMWGRAVLRAHFQNLPALRGCPFAFRSKR